MWTIFKDNEVIANWKEYQRDMIDMKLSLYRGPNRIIWYAFDTQDGFMTNHTPDDLYTITITEHGVEYIKYNCCIRSITWNQHYGCMEILFVPDLVNALNSYDYDFTAGIKTVEDLVNRIVPERFNYSVAEQLKDVTLFNQYSSDFRPLDFLCQIARDIGDVEIFVSDTVLVFGETLANESAAPVGYNLPSDNTYGITRNWLKEIISITTSSMAVIPGTVVQFDNIKRRVVHTHYIWGPDPFQRDVKKESVNVGVTTLILTDDLTPMSEIQYADILPYEDKIILENIISSEHKHHIQIGHIDRDPNGITTDIDSNTHTVNININAHNMDYINLRDPWIATTVQSSPFCGQTKDNEFVGIVYPRVDKMYEVILNTNGYHDAKLTVANLWNMNGDRGVLIQEDADNLLDYRFDLPGATSEYHHSVLNTDYGKDGNTDPYIIYNEYVKAMKGNMSIGIWSDPQGTELPVVDVGGLTLTMDTDSYELSSVRLWAKEKDSDIYTNEMYLDFAFGSDNVITLANDSGNLDIDISGDTTLDATSVNINSGTKGAARVDDTTIINTITDSSLITWFATINTWAVAVASALNTLGIPTPYTQSPPTTLSGKIDSGSGTVDIGD